MPDGNESQIRIIAEQIARQSFQEWKRDQENERSGITLDKVATWVALVLAIGGVLWQAAVTTQRVNESVRRIENIEAFGLDKNFARLEAKVDLLVEERDRRLDANDNADR